MAASPETLALRALQLNRLAALLYGTATVDLPMCPPWSDLSEDAKQAWRDQVKQALRGTHPYFTFHKP